MTVLLPARDKLNEICLARINKMIERGAIDDVKEFTRRYPNYKGPLRRVIGHDEAVLLSEGKISRDECVALMHVRTRRYAKRQSTWFRNKLSSAEFVCKFGNEVDPADFVLPF
jgi:tRNA dimethylallyltransferase